MRRLIQILCASMLGLVGCDDDDQNTNPADTGGSTDTADTAPDTNSETSDEAVSDADASEAVPNICLVTDVGGIDDNGFNETAWNGLVRARDELGVTIENTTVTAGDYVTAINDAVEADCTLIVGMGFSMGDAIASAAADSPEQRFAIVDYSYDPAFDNVVGIVFSVDQSSFLAGYLAAALTETDTVGTFGGLQIPSVTAFMDGFALGVDYFNDAHATTVAVEGWDVEQQTGTFSDDFVNPEVGANITNDLIDAGADIVFPVAGGTGLGALSAAREAGGVLVIGVDTDWALTAPEDADLILSSVTKQSDTALFAIIQTVVDDTFEGGLYHGDLENDGTALAPFHDLDDRVSTDLRQELNDIERDIISGDIETTP